MTTFSTRVALSDHLYRRCHPDEAWYLGTAQEIAESRPSFGPTSLLHAVTRLSGKDDEALIGRRADGSIIFVEIVLDGNLGCRHRTGRNIR